MVTLKSRFKACTPPRRRASVVAWVATLVLKTANAVVSFIVAAVDSSSNVPFVGACVWVKFKSCSMALTLRGSGAATAAMTDPSMI